MTSVISICYGKERKQTDIYTTQKTKEIYDEIKHFMIYKGFR